MLVASLILVAFFGKTTPCQQAWLKVQAEAISVNYFVDVLAESLYCTRIIDGLLDETIQSLTMHYVWFNNIRTVDSVTYSEYGSVDNATPYVCWHSASSQTITCQRMNHQVCVNIMSDSSCCSHSNAILWNMNEEYLYSSDLFSYTSSCRALIVVRSFVFYKLNAMLLTSRNTIKISSPTPHQQSASLISSLPTTSLAQDTVDPPTGLIIGLTVGSALVIVIGIVTFIFWKKRKSIDKAEPVSNNVSATTNSNHQRIGRFFNVYHNIPILRTLPLFRKKITLKTSISYQSPSEVSEDRDKFNLENTTLKNSNIVDTNMQANTDDGYTSIDYNCSKPGHDKPSDRDYQNIGNNTKHNSGFQKIDNQFQRCPKKDLSSQQIQENQTIDQNGRQIHDYEIFDGNGQQIEDIQHIDSISKESNSNEIINHGVTLSQTYSNMDIVDGSEYSTTDQHKHQQETELNNETNELASETLDIVKPYALLRNKRTCFSNPYNGTLPEESPSTTYFVLESPEVRPYSLAHPVSYNDAV